MTDGGPAGTAGKAAIGDKGHVFIQPHAGQGRGRGQHFPHARAAFGAFITDDDDVAAFDFAVHDGLAGRFFGFKDAGRSLVFHHGRDHRRLLDDAAVRRDVAEQNRQAAFGVMRGLQGPDDGAVRSLGAADVLAYGLAGDRQAFQVDQFRPGQLLEDGADAAGAVQILDVVRPGRAEGAEMRRHPADLVEQLEVDGNAGLMGQGRQVEHRIGGAAQGHVHRQGVSEGLFGQNLVRGDLLLQQLYDLHAGLFGQAQALGHDRRDGAVAGQAQADGFGQTVHGVGREHTGAGAAGGAGRVFDQAQFLLVHLTRANGPDRFKDGDQIDLAIRVQRMSAGQHGPPADENSRQVQTGGGHEHAGDDLIAVGDHDHGVKGVGGGHDFHGIGDQLAAAQGIFHADVIHGDAVADADGGKFHRRAAGHVDAGLDGL